MTQLNKQQSLYQDDNTVVTPFQRGKAEWDNRIGATVVQAKNWRVLALILAGALIVSLVALTLVISQRQVVVYYVQVAADGSAQLMGTAKPDVSQNVAVTRKALADYIKWLRSMSSDAVVVRENWRNVYRHSTQKAANYLTEQNRQHDPLALIGQLTRTVEIRSLLKRSDNTYQGLWVESDYDLNGLLVATRHIIGVFTIRYLPPDSEAAIQANPVGFYVDELEWSEEISHGN